MTAIGYIDIGNTQVKLLAGSELITCRTISEVIQHLKTLNVEQVYVACVADKAEILRRFCKEQGILFHKADVQDQTFGLKLIYKDISKLGVDRWLTMIAVRDLFPNSNQLVVDAGTALKIEAVDLNGCQLGGVIAPGIEMSFSSLRQNTAQLPKVSADFDGQLGVDTFSCIRYGVVMSAVALIEKTQQKLRNFDSLVVTGGDAALLLKHLEPFGSIRHIDNLVIRGLQVLQRRGYFSAKEST